MKKSELKVGVEYAVFMNPSDGRKFLNKSYFTGTPLRAKLVSLDFREQRMTIMRTSRQSLLEPKIASGIAVKIEGRTPKVTGFLPKRDAAGGFIYKQAEQGYRMFEVEPEEQTFEYEYVLLENAGCFVYTWEEYEAHAKAKEEATEERRKRIACEAQARKDAEPDIKARVDALFAVLGTVGTVTVRDAESREGPYDFHLNLPGTEGFFNSVLKGRFDYDQGPQQEPVLIGIHLDSTVGLAAIETIIKAAKEA